MSAPIRVHSHSRRIRKSPSDRQGESLTIYLQEISAYPLLTREAEVALAASARQGDEDALNRLICSNLRFVVSVAKKYRHQGVALEDLINAGNLGLMRAARKFDETRGIKFISYAVWWVRQAILEAMAEQSRIVRVPIGQAGKVYQLGKRARTLQQELGREATVDEIAVELGVTQEEVAATLRIARAHLSLDAPVAGDEDTKLVDFVSDEGSQSPDEPVVQTTMAESLASAMGALRPREQRVVNLYFGLTGGDPCTLEDIGDLLGVSRERVRQIKDRALARLRKCPQAKMLQTLV